MVAVLDEVEVADPVDVDRRHRVAAPPRRGDPLPALAHRRRGGPELAVEVALAAVDRADDRLERDHLHAEVVLAAAPERADDLLERQHLRDVVGLGAQPGGDVGQRAAAALAVEVAACVGVREAGAHAALQATRRGAAGAVAQEAGGGERRGRPARSSSRRSP